MAGFIFEGEVESLTPRQQELVSEVLQNRGLEVKKVLIETLGKAGDNYAANVKTITAALENGESFKMVAKLIEVAPTNEIVRAMGGTVILFGTECAMYNEILPKFAHLQQAAGLSKEEFFRFPECYGTLMEPMNEIILLEDLRASNFQMLDRFTPLSNESVRPILKNFAKLHSLSFALKKQDPEAFDTYKGKFIDFFGYLSAQPEFMYFLASLEEDTISLLDSERYKKPCRGLVSKLADNAKIYKHVGNLRYSVVIHGDCWTNNFMFRLEENVAAEAILIDYQLSNIGNPVSDLQYMIFSSTNYSERHQYYYEWIDYYHSELDKSLANFGLKANYVYNRDQLDADLRRYSKVFFATAILLYSILIRKNEDAAKMKEAMQTNGDIEEMTQAMAASNLDPASVALYKSKVEDLVESYIEFGYLQ